jgi:hypothetical protein
MLTALGYYCGHPNIIFKISLKTSSSWLIKQFFHEHLAPKFLADFSNEFTTLTEGKSETNSLFSEV